MNSTIIPIATYRLQFNHEFNFKQAKEVVDYLNQLGITHCYASPLLAAKPGSTHGYDVVDYSQINPEIGTLENFHEYIEVLKHKGMELILDIVTNHMYIIDEHNHWWQDILENGPSSPFADYFDIDWHPPRAIYNNKVLLPILDQQYGSALENQQIKVIYQNGAFFLEVYRFKIPTDPKSWNLILEAFDKEVQKILHDHEHTLELKSIVTALSHLPSSGELENEKVSERLREKEMIKKRLESLLNANQSIFQLLSKQLEIINGKKGDPLSFDYLETFLNAQSYKLCFWRVANDEINFRRFFDIFEYAGIRTENLHVFQAVHELICSFIEKKWIKGLRIDHIDGLWDPEKYLQEIQKYCQEGESLYVIAEKILIGNEKLRIEWQTQGTVGYDFLNQLNHTFVYSQNKKSLITIYQNFTGLQDKPIELAYDCKRLVLDVLLSSELHMLARRLDHIAASHRSSQDFSAESLKWALRDVIACFPVYRSYIRAEKNQIHEEDRQYILSAVAWAKRRNPVVNRSIFNFIQDVLLLEFPEGLDDRHKIERRDFVMRFQQLTGPIMAKGLEDTAFYRYYPLSSLNEVGGDLQTFGMTVEMFHKKNLERLEYWPHSMLGSTTHDTKRSEDVRARINVLSEIPKEWEQTLERWCKINERHKIQDGDDMIPDRNEEYLLYQTLIGTWPLQAMNSNSHAKYIARIRQYMEKAIKEAKVHSSWINPNSQHDQAVQQFIDKILNCEDENEFLKDFKAFMPKISQMGMLNSLSQTLLKLTSPGVPDIYQGNELWDFSLVDPDNRRPVDYSLRKQMLADLSIEKLEDYIRKPEDGYIKLYMVQKTLQFRKKFSEIFSKGSYLPLEVKGKMQNHVIAFARMLDKKAAIIIVGRFFTFFMKDFLTTIEQNAWQKTFVELPQEFSNCRLTNIFDENKILSKSNCIALENAFKNLPVVLIECSFS